MSRDATTGSRREPDGYQIVKLGMMTRKRRSLVLTDEAARHPFRASLPPRAGQQDDLPANRMQFLPMREDIRGFATTYFATLAAALVFLA